MKKLFSNGFYKFLLSFSLIILLSIGTLIFLGSHNAAVNIEALPAESE
jgi:hypothetical protein